MSVKDSEQPNCPTILVTQKLPEAVEARLIRDYQPLTSQSR